VIGQTITVYRSEADRTIFEVASGVAAEAPSSLSQIQALLRVVADKQALRLDTSAEGFSQSDISGRTGYSFSLSPRSAGGVIGSGRVVYTSEGRWIFWVAIAPPGNTIGLTERGYLASARIEVQ
jgi:hypothetical protein